MVERIPDPVIPGKLIVGQNDVPFEEVRKAGITVIVDLNQDDNERKGAPKRLPYPFRTVIYSGKPPTST